MRHVHARAAHYYNKASWESCIFISIIIAASFLFFVGLIVVGATNGHHDNHHHDHGWWENDATGMTTLTEYFKSSTDNMFVYRPYDCERKGKPFARHSAASDDGGGGGGEGGKNKETNSGLTGGGKASSSSSSWPSVGHRLPAPREISNRVCNRTVYQTTKDRAQLDHKTKQLSSSLDFFRPNQARLSNFAWVWGQFVQQCIVSTEGDAGRTLTLNFTGDAHFDPRSAGYLVDLEGVKSAGKDDSGKEILSNTLSPLLDASCVYGNDPYISSSLRSFQGGRLRMARSMSDEAILPMDDRRRLFLAGDPRVNENAPLTAMYTLWTREHNSVVDSLREIHPDWEDEHLYWLARRIVTAEIQAITYHEWLPALFGGEGRVPPLERTTTTTTTAEGDNNNNNNNNAVILSLAFSVVAFRAAHSMVPDALPLISPGVGGVVDIVPLHNMFMNPELIRKGGIDAVLAGLAASPMEEVDVVYADSLRDALFVGGPSRDVKLDLASLDISRGREAKIGSYGELREALGLRAPERWEDVTNDLAVIKQLKAVYPDGPASMDPIIGMLAEEHMALEEDGEDDCVSPLPPTMAAVWKQEFADVRNGDGFYYEVDPGMRGMKDIITQTRLHHVILRNTNIAEAVLLGNAAPTSVLPPVEFFKRKHKEEKKMKKHRKKWKHKHKHKHHKHGDDDGDYEKHINEGKKTDTSLFFTNGRLDDLYYPPPPPAAPERRPEDKKHHDSTKKKKKH